jgi:hypothetical protein
MHLQTGFSICHWTYHVKVSENELRKEIKKRKKKIAANVLLIVAMTNHLLISQVLLLDVVKVKFGKN